MNLFNNEKPLFINFSGIIDELGHVQLEPLLQSTDRPNLAKLSGKSNFFARLYYNKDGVIERNVHSFKINACDTEEKYGLEQTGFWVSLPHVNGANLIQLLQGEDVVFEQRIVDLPKAKDIDVKTVKNRIDISWESQSQAILAFYVALKFENGKSISLGMVDKENKLSFEIEGLPNGGKARVEVTATDGLVSVSTNSKPILIDACSPLGSIISPHDGAQFEEFEPISLMANCYDAFGEQVNWQENQVVWVINGDIFTNNSPIELLKNIGPGNHTIELVSKYFGVLSTATINVKEPSDQFKRHEELFAKLR